tara:strand:- start:77264 stop:79570 length:2307 start_codon:yes stop_codon:yes gene_type:complete
MTQTPELESSLVALLQSLRQRVRRYVVWDSLLAIAVVVLGAFWIGIALDYGPVMLGGTEMPRLARMILLLILGVLLLAIVSKMLIGRLRRPLPNDSLALLVERHHPQLGGRLVTAVQLTRPDRTGDSHAPELLDRVCQQAAAAVDRVDPNRVFRWQPLIHKALIAAPLLFAAIVLAIVSPQAFGRAAGRLSLLSDDPWPRRASLEMVGIEMPVISPAEDDINVPELKSFTDKTIRLPIGSDGSLRIRAAANDAEVPVVCTVHYWTDEGTRGQSNMRRVGRVVDGYQSFILDGPPLAGLSESFTMSVRGLDDRLDGYRVEAVPPPALTDMTIDVRYPAYLRDDASDTVDLQTQYKAGLRISEGSDVTMRATSSLPLGEMQVLIKTDAGEELVTDIDFSQNRTQANLHLPHFDTATAIRIVPIDVDGISAQAAYRYFLGVVLDQPPELKLDLQGIGTAVTPIARLPIAVHAVDDYGIESLTVSVAPAADSEVDGVASTQPDLDRSGEAVTELDLRDLQAAGQMPEIKPGGAINVFGEASDRYDLGESHLTRSEVFRLQVVTADKLLSLMERRELALRARLEQTIDETRNLREALDVLRRRSMEAAETDAVDEAQRTRDQQLHRLRSQQSGLQASKTGEELSGIAASLDDLLQEMINNRVDSVDRRERIGTGVRDPLRQIIAEPLRRLQVQIKDVEAAEHHSAEAAENAKFAVESAEEVLLRLTEVLERMLDLESYNEILDMVRELIDDQQELLDETKQERKKRVLDLFKN